MRKTALSLVLAAQTALVAPALAAGELKVEVKGVAGGKPIPPQFAYCVPDGAGKYKNGSNINPEISWSGAPKGTKSFALIMVDLDVPATFELANKDGKAIPADFPRQNFYHWVLKDIPPTVTRIAEGADSKGITEGGKKVGKTEYGYNGHNDYRKVYGGSFGGYDGPCPPWNDERLHHYYFVVYALDVEGLWMDQAPTGLELETAMANHILAKGEVMGTYTNNAALLKAKK